MNIKEFEQNINNFSLKLINYEDGDIMLLSDLIEEIDGYIEIFNNNKYFVEILIIVKNVLILLLKNSKTDELIKIISIGIDIISQVIKDSSSGNVESPTISENVKFKTDEYVRKFREYSVIEEKKEDKSQIDNISNNSELLNIFFTDCEERLTQAEDCLMDLEKDLGNKEIINVLFRVFHTIKGERGFLKIAYLGEVTHNLETLLDHLRRDEIENNDDVIDIMLSGIDYSRLILEGVKKGDITNFDEINIDTFTTRINEIIENSKKTIGDILKDESVISEINAKGTSRKQNETSFPKKMEKITLDSNLSAEDDIRKSINRQILEGNETSEKNDPVIKVKASQINFLVDMIGELLTIESQFDDRDRNILQLKKITKSIQNSAMQLRTIKIKNLFINIKRAARDVAKKLGKDIEIETCGDELEIDRNLVEILEEPLLHIVRNSCHHGIEEKDERREKNKSVTGNIKLKAERRGNHIIVSIYDDGKGLDIDKILAKAIEKRLVSEEKAKTLTKNEICNFIFLPGFSTANSVDTISGRGVGMDIVKNSVNGVRGRIEIKTEKNLFTEINLIFPLSLAIIDGMVIKSADNFYILPVSDIIESVKLKPGMIVGIENRASIIHLREEIIPAINIGDFFGYSKDAENCAIAVIVHNDDKKYGLLIDDIISKKEVVIKSLGNKFKNLRGISSCAVLFGGKIGFVLNVEEIVSA